MNAEPPRAFLSYSWDDESHKAWVRGLASRLRDDGVDATLDHWAAVPGDQLPQFMETAIRENSYVVIICTPNYRVKSDKRKGGVGYEGDIMTAEILAKGNHRKFIPILRQGSWDDAVPTWLSGKFGINLTGDPYSEDHYHDLVATLHNRRQQAPPVGKGPPLVREKVRAFQVAAKSDDFVPVKITGVLVDEVGKPRNDGSRGSALYTIPFKLNYGPPPLWNAKFVQAWNFPPEFTMTHRSGIASVRNDRLILDGTTIEEVEQTHRKTLSLCVDVANSEMAAYYRRQQEEDRRKAEADRSHEANVRQVSDRLRFD